jgi:hypothetical protein
MPEYIPSSKVQGWILWTLCVFILMPLSLETFITHYQSMRIQENHTLGLDFFGVTGAWTQSLMLINSHATAWATLLVQNSYSWLRIWGIHSIFTTYSPK